jgi:hypothetical protein
VASRTGWKIDPGIDQPDRVNEALAAISVGKMGAGHLLDQTVDPGGVGGIAGQQSLPVPHPDYLGCCRGSATTVARGSEVSRAGE